MANCITAEIPLTDIERMEIYINSPRKSVSQIKRETGADYILNGTLYNMSSGDPVCHLKVDGKVLANPDYGAWVYTWDVGPDIVMVRVPGPTKMNHIAGCLLINDGVAQKELYYDAGMGGARGRSAIGIKDKSLALYCSKDGTSYNMTPEALRNHLHSSGWDSAILLDGGGSSQCDFEGDKISSSRKVQHLILVYTKTGKCPYIEPIASVRNGRRGEDAKWVQWYLNKHGASLTVDGIFGTKSVTELKDFQKRKRLTVDGVCGPATRKELKKL